MGIKSSKQVCISLLEACQTVEESGAERFDIDHPLMETLHRFWDELPLQFKTKIKGHRAVERISRAKSSIGLSILVQSRLTEWSSNVENLFKEDLVDQSISRTNVIFNIASCLSVLDHRSEFDDIRWRICTVVLFRVKRQISSAPRLSQEGEQALLQFLVQLGLEKNHQAQAGRWANIGERYESLAQDLGGLGILATLPSDGSRDLWESRIPKEKGHPREDAIKLLKEKGISKAAQATWETAYGKTCANDAVDTIVETVLARIDATGTVFVQQSLPLAYVEGPKKKDRGPRGRRASSRAELDSRSKRKKGRRSINGGRPSLSVIDFDAAEGIPLENGLNDNCVAKYGRLGSRPKALVTILGHLGEASIPEDMLLYALQPQKFWNRAGEIEEVTPHDLPPMFTNVDNLTEDVGHLEAVTLVTSTPGLLQRRYLSVDPELRMHVEGLGVNEDIWKIQAAKLVFWTFPPDDYIAPLFYAHLGRSQLPHLQRVLGYLFERDLVRNFPVREIFNVCLSSSQLSDVKWKREVLRRAEMVLEISPHDAESWARLRMRRRELSRLYPGQITEDRFLANSVSKQDFGPNDPLSNVYYGQMVLSNAQDFIEDHDLAGAWAELNKFTLMNEGGPSTLEIGLMQQVTFLRGKICRFRGNFKDAECHLNQILDATPKSFSVNSGVMVHLIAVHCETGHVVKAMKLAEVELDYLEKLDRFHEGRGRRFRLAVAETSLMEALWTAVKGGSNLLSPLLRAQALFKEIECTCRGISDGKIARLHTFRISAAFAIILHLQGHLQDALAQWRSTMNKAQAYWGEDFGMMICFYSMSEITRRLGNLEESEHLANDARRLFKDCGLQYYLLALGSLWFNFIGDSIERSGGLRIGYEAKRRQ